MLNTPAVGLLALLGLGALTGCSEQKAAPPVKLPVPVTVAVVAQRPVPVELQAVGQVEASSTVTVRSQVPGVVAEVHFREGATVRKGDHLFTLDQRPFQSALSKAEADLEQSRVAAENASREAIRYRELLAGGFVSRDEAEGIFARADSLLAAVAASRAGVENARIQLAYCTIRAPQGGRTGALLVHPGTVVKANDAPDLVMINTLEPVLVNFSIPEKQLAEVRRHLAAGPMAMTALAPGDTGDPETGTITFLDNAVDSATGTIRLKGTFANPNSRLWPGQFVAVQVVLETRQGAVTVPTASVQNGQQGNYLFVVKEDRSVELRPVTVAFTVGDQTVIAAGVVPGETVVTEGQQRLAPGAEVQVKEPAAPSRGSKE